MKRYILPLVIIAPLLGAWSCANKEPASNHEEAIKAIYAIETGYAAVNATVLAYDKLPLCPTAALCRTQATTVTLGKALDTAETIIFAAEQLIKEHPEIDAAAVLDGAQKALNTTQVILTTYNVKVQ